MPEVFEEDLEEAAAEALQLSNLLVQDSVFWTDNCENHSLGWIYYRLLNYIVLEVSRNGMLCIFFFASQTDKKIKIYEDIARCAMSKNGST